MMMMMTLITDLYRNESLSSYFFPRKLEAVLFIFFWYQYQKVIKIVVYTRCQLVFADEKIPPEPNINKKHHYGII